MSRSNRDRALNAFEGWVLEVITNDEPFTYDMYYDSTYTQAPAALLLTRAQFRYYLPRIVEKHRRFGWRGALTPFARLSRWTESERVFTDRNQQTDIAWNPDGSYTGIGRTTARTDEYVGTRTWTVYYVETQPDPDLHPREYQEWKNSLL